MRLLLPAALMAVSFITTDAPAQPADAWPQKPITLIVPFPAGSGSDVVGRIYAKAITEALKVPAVVDNRPGANAMIGSQLVANAAPDGYTVLIGSGTANAVNYALFADRITYKPQSFTTVSLVSAGPVVMFAQKALEGATLQALVAAAAKSGKGLTCGNGNAVTQVACEVFRLQAKLDVVSVPYKGNAQSLQDVAGGQISIAFSDMSAASPFVGNDRVRAVAVAANDRLPAIGGVPTFKEQGYPDFQFLAWTAVFVPAKTPPAVVQKLNDAALHMLRMAEWERQREAGSGIPVTGELKSSQEFVATEIAKWARYILQTGVKPQ
ncbi:MAG: tripartite tricarboxylate transporter substrate binding protein [Betaproteobacteria bacterium]|nr:tripartite tricarboxylate transporter substrate binding protein [Betaproteobacteria bacterium]